MVHINTVHKVSEMEDNRGNRKVFSIAFVAKKSGELIRCDQCICTSSYNENRTRNIKLLKSKQTRKIRDCLIVEFNGQKVFL